MSTSTRDKTTSRDLSAGCFVCHGHEARWCHSNAKALAAQHHDRTGHPTWCDAFIAVRYGARATDPRQLDLEETIAAAAPDPGRQPEVATRPVPDAPRLEPLGESVSSKPLIETRSSDKRGARGTKPEHHHA